jgi:Zn-dependent protease with chaperone function
VSELHGQWVDGVNAQVRAAHLTMVSVDTIRLTSDSGTRDFAIAELQVSPRIGTAPRIIRLPGHGQIECADSPLFDQWFAEPNRIEAMADWLERRRAAALTAAVLTVLGLVVFFKVGLPWLAERAAPHVPPKVERTMSEQVMALLERTHELRPSKLTQSRQAQLQGEFANLTAGLPRQPELRLLFRDAPGMGPNAFALPDGEIVMTDELVALAKSDDELVAVLAHEIGHHEHHHALRQTLESSGIVVVAALLFGDVSGSSLSISLPVVLLETGFSRTHESEADDFAFRLLLRKGKSPQAFADILKRLSKELAIGDSGPIGYLSTHPPSAERIQRAEQAAAKK